MALSGVDGLMATPAVLPSACYRVQRAVEMRPGLGMHGDVVAAGLGEGGQIGVGRPIIRWQSNGFFVRPRIALMTGGPKVMLGTKCPSITSRWIQSAPALSTASTSSPSLERSNASTDGAIRVFVHVSGPFDGIHGRALCPAALRLAQTQPDRGSRWRRFFTSSDGDRASQAVGIDAHLRKAAAGPGRPRPRWSPRCRRTAAPPPSARRQLAEHHRAGMSRTALAELDVKLWKPA